MKSKTADMPPAAKIALLIPNLNVGGSERNILALGELLLQMGFDIEVWLTGSDSRQLTTRLPVVAFDGGGASNRAMAVLLRCRWIGVNIGRYRPDCMIAFLESSNIPAAMAGLRTGVPTIVSVRGNPERFIWFYRVMAFALYRFARSVVLPSQEAARVIARRYGLRNTVCIPNVVAVGSANPDRNAEKLYGPMIAVGRFVPGKRFDEVIQVAERLRPGGELLLVGDGPERSNLERQAEGARVTVRFPGPLNRQDVLCLLRGASALLCMSMSECWPNVVAEALATGTPVIARDCNYGPREMIKNGVNGFLVKSYTDIALRADIAKSLTDVPTYLEMCRRAAETASSWTPERIGALWKNQILGARV